MRRLRGSDFELFFFEMLFSRGQLASSYILHLFLALSFALSWHSRRIVSTLAQTDHASCDSCLCSSSKLPLVVFSVVLQMFYDLTSKGIMREIHSERISSTFAAHWAKKGNWHFLLMCQICDGCIIEFLLPAWWRWTWGGIASKFERRCGWALAIGHRYILLMAIVTFQLLLRHALNALKTAFCPGASAEVYWNAIIVE